MPVVVVVVSCAALATGLTFAVTGGVPAATPALKTPVTAVVLPTRASPLSRADIILNGRRPRDPLVVPSTQDASWTATDPERSIVLQRGPGSWYVLLHRQLRAPRATAPGHRTLPPAASEPAPPRETCLLPPARC